MPTAKAYLQDLSRTPLVAINRQSYLRLDMNENPDGLPEPFVRDVLGSLSAEYLATYPEYGSLIGKIAGHCSVDLANICLTNGSDSAIKLLFNAYVSPGDKVVVTDPTFAMYPVYCQMHGADAVVIPYHQDFSFPVEEFMASLKSGVKLAVCVNPSNPTGTAIDRETLETIILHTAELDVLLIIDEAYYYYYQHTAIGQIRRYDNVVVLRTFSKLCGMAALRLGYAAASEGIIENIYRVKPTFEVNSLAVCLANALLDRPDIIEEMIQETKAGKEFLLDNLKRHSIPHRNSEANFVLIDCGNFASEIVRSLKNEGILVAGGFRQEFLRPYIRISIGSEEKMKIFFHEFVTIWKNTITTNTE